MTLAPPPVRLRPVTDQSIGTTAFFRNRPLLEALCERIDALDAAPITVLFHACSIGAEVYSFLIALRLHPTLAARDVRVVACDIEPSFVEFARAAVYPRAIVDGMSSDERAFFEEVDAQNVRVVDDLRALVSFAPAASFVDFTTPDEFDIVFLLNALLYVPGAQQSIALDQVSAYNRSLLVTTGFHFDRIRGDMQRNGYRPVGDCARAIHDAWLDRRRDATNPGEVIPGKIYHTWSLPPFSEVDDVEYVYCALFEKHAANEI